MWGGAGPIHATRTKSALASAHVCTRQPPPCKCTVRGIREWGGGEVPREPLLEPFTKTRLLRAGTSDAAFEGFKLTQPGIRFVLPVMPKVKTAKAKGDQAEAMVRTGLPLKMNWRHLGLPPPPFNACGELLSLDLELLLPLPPSPRGERTF